MKEITIILAAAVLGTVIAGLVDRHLGLGWLMLIFVVSALLPALILRYRRGKVSAESKG